MEQKKANTKKFSIEDFKSTSQAIESNKLLEMITGGVLDTCHVTDTGGGGGGSFGQSFTKTGGL